VFTVGGSGHEKAEVLQGGSVGGSFQVLGKSLRRRDLRGGGGDQGKHGPSTDLNTFAGARNAKKLRKK